MSLTFDFRSHSHCGACLRRAISTISGSLIVMVTDSLSPEKRMRTDGFRCGAARRAAHHIRHDRLRCGILRVRGWLAEAKVADWNRSWTYFQ